jgi:hypothetical protein
MRLRPEDGPPLDALQEMPVLPAYARSGLGIGERVCCRAGEEEFGAMSKIKRHILEDGKWYPVPQYHGCCNCGLVHKIDFRLQSGILRWRWIQKVKLTQEVRRAKRNLVVR